MVGGRDNNNKKGDLGRKSHYRKKLDKRARNENEQEAKRRKLENGEEAQAPIYATQFSAEDIASEERRPKKKVAVMIGYSGTGYHGMQLNPREKTIEGDLFSAFVAAGAISKANAEDPKKSSLVRCARTDKGVHAAGNVVSLKLIVEDPEIVQKINENLSPQIRVWGIEVTNKTFSSYQLCDSRMYEYLMPSHCFLPPHPSTYLGQKIKELAEENGESEAFLKRQQEVLTFWNEIDEQIIKPILAQTPDDIRQLVEKALILDSESITDARRGPEPSSGTRDSEEATSTVAENDPVSEVQQSATEESNEANSNGTLTQAQKALLNETIKSIKAAYVSAKRAYRIPEQRIRRIQDALDKYLGTCNFHNYTIQKSFQDPSAKRFIRSFVVNPEPIIINGTEWLSLKVHGQSFMMHQIRKMVAMVALVVRCGCDPKVIQDSYGPTRIPIPKVPGLGLLLERPLFESYNKRAQSEFSKNAIDFAKYEKEMEEFKQREIYNRIFHEEEESNAFGLFFNHIDHFQNESFLYVTAGGIPASQPSKESSDGATTLAGGNKIERDALAAVESDADGDDKLDDGEEGG